jgi:membrane fusion protein (multidrug efflux system)
MPTGNKIIGTRFMCRLTVAVAVGVFLCRCSGDPTSKGPESADAGPEEKIEERVPVKVVPVEAGSISSYLISSATADAEARVEVFSKATGICAEVLVEEGDRVEKGQALIHLEDAEVRLAEKQARINRDRLHASLKRAEHMLKERLLSDEQFEDIRYGFEAADAEWKLANIRLEDTTVTAPIAGTIANRNVKPGVNVTPAQNLFRIVDFDSLIATVFVPEIEMGSLRLGQKVLVSADALPGKSFEGDIKRISPVVDPASGTIKVTVDLSKNCDELVPGLFIRVKIVLDTHDLALIIPKRALLKEEKHISVFTVKDGVAARIELSTGFSDAERVEVLGGLGKGDLVVVDGQSRLGDGMSVKIIENPIPSAG